MLTFTLILLLIAIIFGWATASELNRRQKLHASRIIKLEDKMQKLKKRIINQQKKNNATN